MGASKYLPPFTAAERSAISGERARQAAIGPTTPVDPGASVGDGDVTYADFLGDEVDG